MLKSKSRNSLSILVLLLFCATPLFGQDAAKPDKLFDRDDTLNVTLTAPWRDIEHDEKNQDPYPATIEFTDELGNKVTLDMTAARRGITRQRVCDFPPIKLRLEKEAAKGTTFRGQKSLKMVTHCKRANSYEQYFLLEMLAYKMYNLLTDYSFRVRPLNATYVDSESGKKIENRFGFLIEDDSDVAKRHDLKKLNVPKIRVSRLEPGITSQFSLFQYMIGNVDWAALSGPNPTECCHNVKLIGPEPLQANDLAYPIPYDFDSAGMVDAPYAAPPNGLPIKKVTQRLYRGYCRSNDTLQAARQKTLEQETAIYALIDNESRLTKSRSKKANRYMKKFFKIIKDDDDFDKYVIRKCRK
jgi:hypothetical protein